jgi:cell fate (sporulation/competence/biofilm development) regulator YmcA (YheA/YmcA/DUF963 family)
MSLLRSYSFGQMNGVDELPEEILRLFTDLVEIPEKQIEFASEIISAAMQGNIDLEHEFNIDAYESAIRKNIRLGKEAKRKKEVFLDYTDSSDSWEETAQAGGIKADVATLQAVNKMEDAYEQIMLEDELQYAVETIKSLQPMLLIEARIDFLHTMKQALKGIPESVKILQNVCNEYEVLAEQVRTVLSSGYTFEEIFA